MNTTPTPKEALLKTLITLDGVGKEAKKAALRELVEVLMLEAVTLRKEKTRAVNFIGDARKIVREEILPFIQL